MSVLLHCFTSDLMRILLFTGSFRRAISEKTGMLPGMSFPVAVGILSQKIIVILSTPLSTEAADNVGCWVQPTRVQFLCKERGNS